MKTRKYLYGLLAVAFITNVGFSQTAQQRRKITSQYNVKKVRTLAQQLEDQYYRQKEEAFDYALSHGLPVVKVYDNGEKSYLYRLGMDGAPLYRKASNVEAGHSIGTDQLYPGGDLGLQLEGEGMNLAVWDGGKVRETHELLEGTVDQQDGATQYSDHATHVAGTMAGKELTSYPGSDARGMAYKAHLDSYNWVNDLSEMYSAAADGLLVSNHSYGLDATQIPNPSLYLGHYGQTSSSIDDLIYLTPHYTIVAAAGNDRDTGLNAGENGYNILLGQMTTAKNDIVVAAVKKVDDYTGPGSVHMSNFSSWGPTNDRRIKPDISADGVFVFSSTATSDTSYEYYSGTSMASPTVSGSLILLQELSADLNDGDFLLAATIKAIMIETAHETGSTLGPDAKYGWGLLNMEGAAQLMIDSDNDSGAFYEETTLDQGETYQRKVIADDSGELKVTIAWTDPSAPAQGMNDDSPVLVNDLDLRITDTEGNTFYPWRLHSFNNFVGAVNDGDNDRDNVEQIVVPDAVEGEMYRIQVTHKDDLKYSHQDFSIAFTGIVDSGDADVAKHQLNGFKIYPNPATDQFNLSLEKPGNTVNIDIYNINGKRVLSKNFDGTSGANYPVQVANLTTGVYFVKVQTEGKKATKKLIIK